MNLFLSLILVSIATLCYSQNEEQAEIVYEAVTRGSSIKIEVEGNNFIYTNNNKTKELKLTKEQLNLITAELNKVNLYKLKKLKAPSTKSHSDAALQSILTITYQNKTYRSTTFDHGNPPKEIRILVTHLFEMIE